MAHHPQHGMRDVRSVAALLILCSLLAGGCGYSLGDFDLLDEDVDPFDAEAINFAVIGDWGRGGWFQQDNVANALGDVCEDVNCRFVISTGDNFYVDGVESTNDPKWARSYENVFTSPSLYVPWYVTLGNHDYMGSVTAQIDYSEISDRWTLPSRYFAVEISVDDTTTALLAFLDTVAIVEAAKGRESELAGQIEWDPDRQLAWLDSTLSATRARWRFVAGHHPVMSASARHRDSPILEAGLRPILQRGDVTAYLSGHVHSLQHLRSEDGMDFIVSGGGSLAHTVGTHQNALFAAGVSGFALISMTTDEVRLRLVDHNGTIGYQAAIVTSDAAPEM